MLSGVALVIYAVVPGVQHGVLVHNPIWILFFQIVCGNRQSPISWLSCIMHEMPSQLSSQCSQTISKCN